jgi:hypoxanthine phosphoribosyltransferase
MTTPEMHILMDQASIEATTARLAESIDADGDGELTVLAVMDGALWITADLLRKVNRPIRLMTIRARSYTGRTNGQVELLWAPDAEVLRGQDVLILDDILDTGQTLRLLIEEATARGAGRVRTCVLLRKDRSDLPDRLEADFVGADIPDVFVVGYGLDNDGLGRNWRDIYALDTPGT